MSRTRSTHSAEPLSHLTDEYLSYLQESSPTEAAFDGVHAYDDLLEDFSREAIDSRGRELGGWARRLEGINPSTLNEEERLDRQVLSDSIRARLYTLEELRPWQRNPQLYAETLASSLAGQALFDYAPVAERGRRVVSKLRQVPRFLEAARKNVTDPPGLFAKVGLESFEGVLTFVERDLPRAFRALDDIHLLSDLADASAVAVDALSNYTTHLRESVAPKSRASFRLGETQLGQWLRLSEGIDVPPERLLELALGQLAATREQFEQVAGKLGSDAREVWAEVKSRHPKPEELLGTVDEQTKELLAFVRRRRLATVPDHEPLRIAPTPEFYRWTFASLWAPGAFEANTIPAYYYITNVDPSWSPERQEEHLRDFSHAILPSISIHEAYPGHFLHFEHMRRIPKALRKTTFLLPMSVVEGWAHYSEQLMFDEGYAKNDTEARLGQLAEALVRLARTVVGLRLHAGDLSVEQGVRFFREEAFLEESTARREAERGTFDPGYVLYALGKQMLLKLRADYEAAKGDDFSLQTFHDRFLGHGGLPFWAQRQLMLGERGAVLE